MLIRLAEVRYSGARFEFPVVSSSAEQANKRAGRPEKGGEGVYLDGQVVDGPSYYGTTSMALRVWHSTVRSLQNPRRGYD